MDTPTCPHCGKTFRENNSVFQHIKAKHGGKGKAAFKPERTSEQSMAELFIEAERARDMGEPIPEWLENMLP